MSYELDWNYYFRKQKPLSKHIEENHPKEDGEDRIKKKAFALMTEIAECANEEKGCFKFWKANPKANREEMLEECVDIIHFVCDLGIEIDVKDYRVFEVKKPVLDLFAGASYLAYIIGFGRMHRFDDLMSYVTALCEALDFTPEEVKVSYDRKNAINFTRQANAY